MTFNSCFPTAVWVGRKLNTRLSRRLFCAALAITLLSAIALHIEAAVFAYHTRSLLLTLKNVDAGQTTRSELLRLVPTLRAMGPRDSSNCGPAGEAWHIEHSSLPTSKIGQWFYGAIYENSALYKVTYWLGYRPRRLYVDADIEHGVVTRWAFKLGIAASENHYPGQVVVGVSSPISVNRYSESSIADEQNPNFSARRYFKWPEWNLEVSYSRLAPKDIKDIAVDLHLDCLWSVRGCNNAAELLPRADQERIRLRRAAIQRITSAEPCPPSIVPAKVRDSNEIVVLKVQGVTPKQSEWTREMGVTAKYEVLRILALRETSFDRVPRDANWFPSLLLGGDATGIQNPSVRLLEPGATLVAFDGGHVPGSPCNLLPANADILGKVRESLELKDWGFG